MHGSGGQIQPPTVVHRDRKSRAGRRGASSWFFFLETCNSEGEYIYYSPTTPSGMSKYFRNSRRLLFRVHSYSLHSPTDTFNPLHTHPSSKLICITSVYLHYNHQVFSPKLSVHIDSSQKTTKRMPNDLKMRYTARIRPTIPMLPMILLIQLIQLIVLLPLS